MPFGNPELRQSYKAFRLDYRGVHLAKVQGDRALAASMGAATEEAAEAAAERATPKRVSVQRSPRSKRAGSAGDRPTDDKAASRKKPSSAQSPRQPASEGRAQGSEADRPATSPSKRLTSHETERLLQRIVPPPPAPRPPPRKHELAPEPTPGETAFAEKFYDRQVKQHQARLAASQKRVHGDLPESPRLAAGALEDSVHRLSTAAVERQKLLRQRLEQRYLSPRLAPRRHHRPAPPTAAAE